MAALISTIVITVLAVALGVWAFVRNRNWSALVRGIGFGAVFVGLYFLGITELAVQGVLGVVSWVQTTVWTQAMTNAAIATGAGAVIVIIASYLPHGKPAATQDPAAVPAPRGGSQLPAAKAAPGSPRGKQAPADPEDDEIEALLRARNL
ncbi:MAG: hypothetical protein Q3997_00345 [Propionibacteriaceae bacterium]|nr:hypothetical protein [Propionibacteriaceae bacterium]